MLAKNIKKDRPTFVGYYTRKTKTYKQKKRIVENKETKNEIQKYI